MVCYEDFKRVFHSTDDELESHGGATFEPIQPKNIPELVDQQKPGEKEELVTVTDVHFADYKVKMKPILGFNQVWNSQDTQSQAQVSLWAPAPQSSIMTNNKLRLNLGMYASKGFSNPLKKNSGRYQLIEITDNATIRLRRAKVLASVVATVCPNPVKYKQVWHFARGNKSLYAWKPIPPDGYISLGMMCTTTDQPPDLKSVRCVPASWCSPTKVPPSKIWDDTGAGGGKPGSIWTINSMDMVAVVPGHDPPTETYYDLTSNRFFLDFAQLPKTPKSI